MYNIKKLCVYVYNCVCVYVYIERDREGEKKIERFIIGSCNYGDHDFFSPNWRTMKISGII